MECVSNLVVSVICGLNWLTCCRILRHKHAIRNLIGGSGSRKTVLL